ncbi:MAG: S9 family peptidase [Planctomycetes bacterium]|nr:S9 family peptidase [Planctomycetota bacterium]
MPLSAQPIESDVVATIESTSPRAITLEQTLGGGEDIDFRGRVPRWRWAHDGRHLVLPGSGRWLAPATGQEVDPIPAPVTPDPLREAGLGRSRRAPRASSEDDRVIVLRDDDAWVVVRTDDDGVRSEPLGFSFDARDDLFDVSPDGRYLAGVEGYDLVLADLEAKTRHRLSADGSEEGLRYGMLDWVYQEEVYGRGRWRAFWWSPDSRHLAFLRLDESGVPSFSIVDHRPTSGRVEVTSYPKAGAKNPSVAVGVAGIDGTARWVDLSKYGDEPIIVARVGWDPTGSRLVLQVQNRIQTWLDLVFVDPETGDATTVLRETSNAWVDVLGAPRWLRDGSFLWSSERTGYEHLYHYGADGTLLRPVTSGDGEVKSVLRIDEERGRLWFTSNRDDSAGLHAYRVALDGSGLVRLTHGDGSHAVTLDESGETFLDEYSSVTIPTQVRLCSEDGTRIQVLESAEPRDLEAYGYRTPERLRIPARDGYEMDAMVIAPISDDPDRRHPVWLHTYSGPDAPTMRDRWQSSVFDQFLVQHGVMVFHVNNRSSSGRGRIDSTACYRDLGASELRDLEDAIAWLVRERSADPERVGIEGWSYGGFMTAYALTHSDRFRLGVAGAGVYDWRNYDTIYTERFMDTPAANPEGYRRSSCVEASGDLHGHLVIVHGMLDDNVHLANSIQLIDALQRVEGASFELMVYPGSRHGLRSREQRRHLRELTWRAIREHLLEE